MRLAKYLAQAGVASRRQSENLIAAGRIKINGIVVRELTTPVNTRCDQVEYDNCLIRAEELIYILLNKPAGFISAVKDPQGRKTVLELVGDIKERIYPVGRLDYDTEGLLLLSNDGDFTNLIIHPRYKIEKKYEVMVEGKVKSEELRVLREGVNLEDGITAPAKVHLIKNSDTASIIEIIIHEGRKRQVKRMCAAIGHPVISLKRTALGFLTLKGVAPGHYRYLNQEEVEQLKALALKGIYNS